MIRSIYIIVLIAFSIPCFAQHLTAPPVYGPSGTIFAQHVAMDALGNRFIASEPYHYEGAALVGRNKVYEKVNNEWQELGDPFIGSSEYGNPHWVDISGDGLVVTMSKFGSVASDKHISTYKWDNNEWILLDDFTPGYKSKLNNNGTFLITSDDATVRVFDLVNDEWQQVGQDIVDPALTNNFGWSIDISDDGTKLVASDPIYNGPNGARSGITKIYELTGSQWVQMGASFNGPDSEARSGWQASISSDGLTVAFTSIYSNNYHGDCSIYTWDGSAWVQKGSTIIGDLPISNLGWELAMSSDGNHVVVSDHNAAISFDEAGQIIKLSYDGSDWVRETNDILGDQENRNDGNALGISDDGNIVLTSAMGNLGSKTGQVRQFEYDKIYGKVYTDYDQDCINDYGVESVSLAELTINPGQIQVPMSEYGYWYIDTLPDGDYTLTAYDSNTLDLCQDSSNFSVLNGYITENFEIGLTPKIPDVVNGQIILARGFDCIDTLPNPIPARYLDAIIQPGDIPITTDYYGKWTVTDLLPGDYTIHLIDTTFIYNCIDSQSFTILNLEQEIQLEPIIVKKPNSITGSIFDDINENCYKNTNEVYVNQVLVKINDQELYATTDSAGVFLFENLPIGQHELIISTPDSSSNFCYPLSINISQNSTTINLGNTSMVKTDACVYSDINVDGNRFRSCFEYQKVNIQVSSPYYSIDSLIDPFILAELDPAISIDSSNFIIDTIAPNIYHFDMPNIGPNEKLAFSFWVSIDCDTPTGATLCNTFTLLPVDTCSLSTFAIPNSSAPCENDWDGSEIDIENECLGDSIRFTIKNNSGNNMSCFVPIEVIENNEIILQDSVKLLGFDSLNIFIPVIKGTYRMTCGQHPKHPGKDRPVSVIERCGSGDWTSGIVNDYYQNDANRHVSVWCPEITGSFDPNDKIGYPNGIGNTNIIPPNIAINYKIRFQNTGNDTAFNIVVLDTLDTGLLNVSTFLAGSSSHGYSYSISNEGILKYTFDNIYLPDSIVDESGSHGYFVYSIQQKEELVDGTVIDNSASINFDFNEPIKTETYSHTVDRQLEAAPCSSISEEEASVEWTGAAGNNIWTDPLNWNSAIIPTECSNVSIVNSGFILLDTEAFCNSITIEDSGSLFISTTGSLDINSLLDDSLPKMKILGYLYNDGMIQLSSSSATPLDITGTVINNGPLHINTSASPAIVIRSIGELQSSGNITIN